MSSIFDGLFTLCLLILAVRLLSWPFRVFCPILGELLFVVFLFVALWQYSSVVALLIVFFLLGGTVSAVKAALGQGAYPGAQIVLEMTVMGGSSTKTVIQIPLEAGRHACVTVPVSLSTGKPFPAIGIHGPMRSWSLTLADPQGPERMARCSFLRIPMKEVSPSVEHQGLELLVRASLLPPENCKIEALIVSGT